MKYVGVSLDLPRLSMPSNGAGGDIIMQDANLYRSTPDQLKTDDAFYVGAAFGSSWTGSAWGLTSYVDGHASVASYFNANALYARLGNAEQVGIGALNQIVGGGPAAAGIAFGSTGLTQLYAFPGGDLRTNLGFIAGGAVQAATEVIARSGSATQTQMGYTGSGNSGIVFGSNADTNLYRYAQDALATDDAFMTRNNFLYPGANLSSVYPKLYSDNSLGAAIGWNFSAGDGEVNFWNTYSTHGAGFASFNFRQMTAAGTATTLASIFGNGNIYASALVSSANIYIRNSTARLYFGAADGANILSQGSDFTMSHQTWAPSFVATNAVYVDYGNTDAKLYFGSSATYYLYKDSASARLRTPNTWFFDAQIYALNGVAVYDSVNGVWLTMTASGSGLKSSRHYYTETGYSFVSGQNIYLRSASAAVVMGPSDNIQMYYYSGTFRFTTTIYVDSVIIRSGEGWTNISYAGSWGGYAAPFYGGQFRKSADNFVHMRGLVLGGAAYSTIGVLPAGYRPAAGTQLIFNQACAAGRVRIDIEGNTGNINVVDDGMTGSASSWTSLSGIHFYAES